MVRAAEPDAIGFPFARSFVCVESGRGTKRDPGSPERRLFVASLEPGERTEAQWLALVRGQWHIENKLHWRKDACWGEDRTRSRNPNIVGALALLRNALQAVFVAHLDAYGSMPAFFEACAAVTDFNLRLVRKKL